MADNFATTMVKADVDAKSLSDFMSKPSSALVPRRLSGPVNTLDYFLDYLKAIEKVYTQQTGVVNVNGVQVKAITQAVIDALNSAAIDNNTQVDTLITATPQFIGSIPRSLASINSDLVNSRTFGANSNADSAAIKKAIDYAVASGNKVVFNFDATIKVPSHAANISDAIHSVASIGNRKFTVLIELGHQPDSGVSLEDGDYSNFSIQSEDDALMLAPSFTGRFISMVGGVAPRLECYVDANGSSLDRIYSVVNGSGFVGVGCGGRGAKGRALYANNSFIYAAGSIWRDFEDQLYASASLIQMGGALIEGGLVTTNGSLVSSRGSSIEAQGLVMNNCQAGLECKRAGSSINAHEAVFTNIGTRFCARASRGGSISLSEATITEVTGVGLEALDGGMISMGEGALLSSALGNTNSGVRAIGGTVALGTSTVQGFGAYGVESRSGGWVSGEACKILDSGTIGVLAHKGGKALISSATVTGSGIKDIGVLDGGELNIKLGTTSNSPVGAPLLDDSNLVGFGTFNSITTSGRGIIWA